MGDILQQKHKDIIFGPILVFAIVLILYLGIPFISGQSTLFISSTECIDKDGDGYGTYGLDKCPNTKKDCDDTLPYINPGATDSCGRDLNCDGIISKSGNCPVCSDSDGNSNALSAGSASGYLNGKNYLEHSLVWIVVY